MDFPVIPCNSSINTVFCIVYISYTGFCIGFDFYDYHGLFGFKLFMACSYENQDVEKGLFNNAFLKSIKKLSPFWSQKNFSANPGDAEFWLLWRLTDWP